MNCSYFPWQVDSSWLCTLNCWMACPCFLPVLDYYAVSKSLLCELEFVCGLLRDHIIIWNHCVWFSPLKIVYCIPGASWRTCCLSPKNYGGELLWMMFKNWDKKAELWIQKYYWLNTSWSRRAADLLFQDTKVLYENFALEFFMLFGTAIASVEKTCCKVFWVWLGWS